MPNCSGQVMTDNQKLGHSFHYVTFLEACRLGSKEKVCANSQVSNTTVLIPEKIQALAHLQIYCKHELVHGCWVRNTAYSLLTHPHTYEFGTIG